MQLLYYASQAPDVFVPVWLSRYLSSLEHASCRGARAYEAWGAAPWDKKTRARGRYSQLFASLGVGDMIGVGGAVRRREKTDVAITPASRPTWRTQGQASGARRVRGGRSPAGHHVCLRGDLIGQHLLRGHRSESACELDAAQPSLMSQCVLPLYPLYVFFHLTSCYSGP